jgi:hypothetical protein
VRAILLAAALLLAGCASAGLPRADPPPVPAPVEGPPPVAAADPASASHGSVSGFLATHFSRRAWDENVVDGYFGTTDPLVPAALAVSALLVRPGDRSLEGRAEGRWGGRSRIGDAGMDLLVAGSVLTGILAPGKGRTAGDETWNQAEAYAASLATTTLLKVAVGRRRPDGGGNSFPSGHSTAAFTAATLLWRNSGPWVGVPACAVAAATAFSRVESGRHYPSDVLAGAAIGVLSAGIIDSLHFGGTGGKGIPGSGVLPFVAYRPRGFEAGVLVWF